MTTLKEREESARDCMLKRRAMIRIACPHYRCTICITLFPEAIKMYGACPCDFYPEDYVKTYYWMSMNPF